MTRALLFLFIGSAYFPLKILGFTSFKLVGWLLAAQILPRVAGRELRASIPRRYSLSLFVLLFAGYLGSISVGEFNLLRTIRMVQNCFMFFGLALLVKEVRDLKLILVAIAVGGGASVLSGLQEMRSGFGRVAGILDNPNGYGQVCGQVTICLVGLALLSRRTEWRVALSLMIVPCLAGLVLSGSRGAGLAMVAGILPLFLNRKTRKLGAVSAIALVFLILYVMPENIEHRWKTTLTGVGGLTPVEVRVALARKGWQVYEQHPVVGVGFGNVRYGMKEIDEDSRYVTHNALTQVMAETGTIGLAAFCFLILSTGFMFMALARGGEHLRTVARQHGGRARAPKPHGPGADRRWADDMSNLQKELPVQDRRHTSGSPVFFAPTGQAAARTSAEVHVIAATLTALLAMVIVAQMASGNYTQSIWYLLFGSATGVHSAQRRYGLKARRPFHPAPTSGKKVHAVAGKRIT